MIPLIDTWQQLSYPEQIFSAIGLISNFLFVLYLLLSFFVGNDHAELPDDFIGDSLLPILSIRGFLAFSMFLGWTALAALRAGLGTPLSTLIGIAVGWMAAWLVWRMLRWMLRWQSSGTMDLQQTIGLIGQVYIPIPMAGQGAGKITIELQGALRELDAVSSGNMINTRASVVVVDFDAAHNWLVVRAVE
jgi:membrane protein implicated in regulation of membrane protease activity